MKYLQFNEPDRVVRVTKEEAIAKAKMLAEYHNFTYDNDEEALQDFIAVHWASWEDEESS